MTDCFRYNPGTGIFNCTLAGTHYFSTTMQSAQGEWSQAAITLNGSIVLCDSEADMTDSGTGDMVPFGCAAVVQLDIGKSMQLLTGPPHLPPLSHITHHTLYT